MLCDRLTWHDFDWRDLWAYVTKAPPGTALHEAMRDGWGVGETIAAEQLYELQILRWMEQARHFEGGADIEFPTRLPRPGVSAEPTPAQRLDDMTLDEIIPPDLMSWLDEERGVA